MADEGLVTLCTPLDLPTTAPFTFATTQENFCCLLLAASPSRGNAKRLNTPPKMAAPTDFNALPLEMVLSATPLANSSKECSPFKRGVAFKLFAILLYHPFPLPRG